MNEVFNKPAENETPAAETSGWDSLANDVPFNNGETEAKAPEKLSEKLEASIAKIDDTIDAVREYIDDESLMALARARGAMEKEFKKARFDEATEMIPEENRDGFIEYSNDTSSIFSIDEIVDGIHMLNDGKSMEDVKEYMVTRDWGGGIGTKENTGRGEVVFNELVDFVTPKSAEK